MNMVNMFNMVNYFICRVQYRNKINSTSAEKMGTQKPGVLGSFSLHSPLSS